MNPNLTQLCKDLEAFETEPWAIEAILDVELMTPNVMDPCCGTGLMAAAAKTRGYDVSTFDIHDWSQTFPVAKRPDHIVDFLTVKPNGVSADWTYFLNPPFSKACEFVDKCKEVGARKIICFQRWAWRESGGRAEWWARNPPSRIWLCIDRATCWRFDVPKECVGEGCGKTNKIEKSKYPVCRKCMGNTTQPHAFFVWERGHSGTAICDLRKPRPKKETV